MADEVPQSQWPWVNSTNSMVSALLSQQPTANGQMVDPAKLGFGADTNPMDTAAPSATQLPIPDLLQAAVAPPHTVGNANALASKLALPAQAPMAPVQATPVKNLVGMADLPLNPQVLAAKQRMVQLLASQPHAIVPGRAAKA
jgi:hypothetical protein